MSDHGSVQYVSDNLYMFTVEGYGGLRALVASAQPREPLAGPDGREGGGNAGRLGGGYRHHPLNHRG